MAYPVFYFHSDMRGAPVLNGVRGTGIALLDAIVSDDPTALVGLPLIRTANLLRAAGQAVP